LKPSRSCKTFCELRSRREHKDVTYMKNAHCCPNPIKTGACEQV
jgi:hypothetical protein